MDDNKNNNKKVIFYLEGRGGFHFYHFIHNILGGLYHIEHKEKIFTIDDSAKYENKFSFDNILFDDFINDERIKIEYPIYFTCDGLNKNDISINDWQKDIISCLPKDKFKFIDILKKEDKNDFLIVYVYGCKATNKYCDLPDKIYPYLRNLFLQEIHQNPILNKRYFITRKGANIFHHGVHKRLILNEGPLMKMLNKYNFEYICLEDINFNEKIKLFNTADIIISSHTGGLTCSLWANKKTKIVEIINKGTLGCGHDHYKLICNFFNIPFYRYSNINEDIYGNFTIDVNLFEKYLHENYII